MDGSKPGGTRAGLGCQRVTGSAARRQVAESGMRCTSWGHGQRQVEEAAQQCRERDLGLYPSQRGPQTEVWPVGEAQVSRRPQQSGSHRSDSLLSGISVIPGRIVKPLASLSVVAMARGEPMRSAPRSDRPVRCTSTA